MLKRSKSFLAFLLTLCVVLSCSHIVNAVGTTNTNLNIATISSTELHSTDPIVEIEELLLSSHTKNDTEIITSFTQNLLIGKTLAENSNANIDFQQIFSSSANTDLDSSLVFFMQKAKLFGEMRAAEGIIITDEELTYDFSTIDFDNNLASVDVTETYVFQINTISEKSTVRTEYHLNFEKDVSGMWKVLSITSNDWFEQEKAGQPFDVTRELATMTVERPAEDQVYSNEEYATDSSLNTRSVVTTDYTVNFGRVYNYAKTFWSSYNSGSGMYGNYNSSGGDCMNFASQCLAVGLGFSSDPTSISSGSAPCDSIGSNKWKPHNSAFLSCGNFRSYLTSNTSA